MKHSKSAKQSKNAKQSKKKGKLHAKPVQMVIPGRGPAMLPVAEVLQLAHGLSLRQQWQQVAMLLQQLLQQTPTLEEGWGLWFKACQAMADFPQLAKVAGQCLESNPRSVPALVAKATALRMQQDHGQALDYIERAVKLARGNAAVLNHLGIIQKELGQVAAALATFNRCLALRPEMTEVYWNRSDLLEVPSSADLKAMQQLLADPKLSDAHRARLHYALARAYEFLGDAQQQFSQVEQGARCKRATLQYDHGEEMRQMASVPECFAPAVLQQPVAAEAGGSTPIFICGLPRSGTTLVEQILSSHAEVTAGDELTSLMLSTAQTLHALKIDQRFPNWAPDLEARDWHTIGALYREKTSSLQHTQFFTDKHLQNYKAIGLIHLALPDAKIVYCRRDPMDTLWGCYRQLFGDGMAFTYDQTELAETWKAAETLLQYWQQQLADKVFVLDYEVLVSNQEEVTRQLLEFIGLPWDPACLRFYENPRAVNTISSVQVRNPINSSRIGQWRNFASGLKEMQSVLKG